MISHFSFAWTQGKAIKILGYKCLISENKKQLVLVDDRINKVIESVFLSHIS